MDFLPNNYEVPMGTAHYTKFLPGNNQVRILTSPIIGWEYFTNDNRPIRSKEYPDQTPNKPPEAKVKHFWAMVVWNYDLRCIQVMQINQKSIQKAVKALADNVAWGTPLDYDIVINKSGEGLETEYNVMPCPKTPVDDYIKEFQVRSPVNLDALYEGKDPFDTSLTEVAPTQGSQAGTPDTEAKGNKEEGPEAEFNRIEAELNSAVDWQAVNQVRSLNADVVKAMPKAMQTKLRTKVKQRQAQLLSSTQALAWDSFRQIQVNEEVDTKAWLIDQRTFLEEINVYTDMLFDLEVTV